MIQSRHFWILIFVLILCITTIGVKVESEAQEWFFGIQKPFVGFLFLISAFIYEYVIRKRNGVAK